MTRERRTARLVMRGWTDADLEPFAELNADPEVMEFFPATLTRAASDALAARAQARLQEDGWGLWALEVGGRFAGFTGLAEIVSFTAVSNERSQAVMRRLGMTRDPADDFDYPTIAEGHPLRRSVVYRIRAPLSGRSTDPGTYSPP